MIDDDPRLFTAEIILNCCLTEIFRDCSNPLLLVVLVCSLVYNMYVHVLISLNVPFNVILI